MGGCIDGIILLSKLHHISNTIFHCCAATEKIRSGPRTENFHLIMLAVTNYFAVYYKGVCVSVW